MNKEMTKEGYEMISLAKELFPICRSIMGEGIRKSMRKFQNIHPEFKEMIFRTGDKVFDWEIPSEWSIKDAYIKHESGIKYAEFSKNNLHVVNYSEPVNLWLDKSQLLRKIHTLEAKPNAIPYVTSYYKRNWGFCMQKEVVNQLPEGNYQVFIDSKLSPGKLQILEAFIPGRSKKEIFFSSYLCHPSMANNELSGPVLLSQIMSYVKNNFPQNEYSYRFILIPETIGSIAYLSKNFKKLQNNMLCGFNLSCVGDERAYSHVESRLGNNLADQAVKSALIGLSNVKYYTFLSRGSDERQFCAPGIDLPVCTFCRSKFSEFPEYHTSLDNFELVTERGLQGSFNIFKNIVQTFEIGLNPMLEVLCEPQLGKRDLYPNISKVHNGEHPSKLRMDVLAYCDSKHTIFDIALKLNVNIEKILDEIKILQKNNLIKFVHTN